MKVFLGTLLLAMGIGGAVSCPDHVRAEAAERVQISDETVEEFGRQLDLFTEYMRGEAPELAETG